jgi:lipoprotein-anchoring transpeptidase ErfK/SrfK
MFVCRGKGVIVSDEPVTFSPAPPPPDLDDDLPYAYAYAKENNTPEYWRIPTPDETEVVAEVFERLTARETKSHQLAEGNAAAQGATPTDARDAGAQDDAGSEETDRDPNPRAVAAVPVDGGVIDPFALPPFVHHRMAKGYYVSLADAITAGAIDYTRTVRGRYVQTEKLYTAKPSRFEGTLINADNPLPFVYMVGGGVKTLKQESSGGPLKNGVSVDRYSRLPYLGKMKRKRRSYVRVGENEFISARTAAVVEAATAPDDLMPGERWIDVSISQQTLVAYEGETPVFATLISSGRKGFETPLGTFRIYNKHVTITMDDPNAGEEAYSIEDVPWTQYFEEGYALHGAFWHNRFGRVRSHGCINLSPADARRLFFWTGPHLFESMHGIAATKTNPGTRVIVHP